MEQNSKYYPIYVMSNVFRVSRSGYYKYLNQKEVNRDDIKLIVEAKVIHAKSKKSYGSRRLAKSLSKEGYKVGRYKARSLMKKAGLITPQRCRFRIKTTDSTHKYPISQNLLNRSFKVAEINHSWASDITYIKTKEGWLYLAVTMDLYSRRIIGHTMADHMREELPLEALKMAFKLRNPNKKVLHHSDRGSQYAGYKFREYLEINNIQSSMSHKGSCYDNAVVERFFGNLKSECVYQNSFETKEEAKKKIRDYIVMFYNKERLHSYLGYMSPIEYEKINL